MTPEPLAPHGMRATLRVPATASVPLERLMTTALIADDEPHLATQLRDQLLALWPQLQVLPTVRNGLQAAQVIAEQQPDGAFLDIKMPGLGGLAVAQRIEGATRVATGQAGAPASEWWFCNHPLRT